jgi:hypothetical protein
MRARRAVLLALMVCLASAGVVRGDDPPADTGFSLRAVRLAKPPTIDGRLEPGEWDGAALADHFVQIEPDEGRPASEATEVHVGYDAENLYFGIRAHDHDPGKMTANILTRDGDLTYDDSIEIVLDTNRDRRTGFLFATNPLGVEVDALVRSEGEDVNRDWDGLWTCKATRDAGGYTVEIAIPFRTLRFPRAEVQTWGFNVARIIPRRRETSFWKPMSKDYGFYARYKVSQFGELTGMTNLEPGRRYLVKPYVTGGWDDQNPERSGDGNVDGGLDVKWSLTTDLVADLTYNTDFAEAEADDQQVNLTRFPLYYPEKREFFLEGANLFYFGERPEPYRAAETQLFFSRRIGLTADGGRQIPVLGGAKVAGQAGPYSLGLLNLTTEHQSFEDLDGSRFSVPRTNYSVARLKRRLFGKSTIGVLGLATEPSGPSYNRVGGADWDFVLNDNLKSGGFLAKSSTPGLDHDNWAGYGDVDWDSKRYRARLSYTQIGDDFLDELGFIPRIGVRKYRWNGDRIFWPEAGNRLNIRQAWFTYGLDYITARDNRLETRINTLQFNTWLNNNAGVAFKYFDELEVLTGPFEISPGVVIPPGSYPFRSYFFGFNTDYSKPLGGAGRAAWGEYYDGHYLQTFYALVYRPLPGLFTAGSYQRTDVHVSAGDYTNELFQGEVTYSFSPTLSTRTAVQWNADQNFRFRFLMRWGFRPGSSFYLVYDDLRDLTDPLQRFDARVGLPGRSLVAKAVVGF